MVPKRFHGPAQVSNAAATKYTVPAGMRATVRAINVQNPSAGSVKLTMSIGADAAATRIFDGYSLLAGQVFPHFCYYVLEAGEILQAFSDTNNILTLTVDGDLDTA